MDYTNTTGTQLNFVPKPYNIYGEHLIDPHSKIQMEMAMSFPFSKAGVLSCDAHQGYALPIGGVWATDASIVVPYAIGFDIACRVQLSITNVLTTREDIWTIKDKLKAILMRETVFGVGRAHIDKFTGECQFTKEDALAVFDSPEWTTTKLLRDLKDMAYAQYGTSGSGNHFVEIGVVDVPDDQASTFNLPTGGTYLSILSHSGSRGFGHNVCTHYSEIAKKQHPELKTMAPYKGTADHPVNFEWIDFSWLDLNTQEGIEYWNAMTLARDYARGNHNQIHNKILKALNLSHGADLAFCVQNEHNLAWKETHVMADGSLQEVNVHRKGATPAFAGQMGIIPATCKDATHVVIGKGNPDALCSSSHGAGRVMSRSKANKVIPRNWKDEMAANLIEIHGAGRDESDQVYKRIDEVMAAQTELVETVAKFYPSLVRMADPREKPED